MNEGNAFVFVVDDDTSVRESLRNLIRSAGFSVQTFSSAQEFLISPRPKVPSCLMLIRLFQQTPIGCVTHDRQL